MRFFAGGAVAPVDDFSFINDEAMVFACRKTRPRAYRTVDIFNPATTSADEVVVVVAGAGFIASGRAHWLNAVQQSKFTEGVQRVIHRLARNRADFVADAFEKFVGCAMGALVNRPQNCQALGCHIEALLAKKS